LNAKGGVGKSFFAVNMVHYLKSLMKENLSDLEEAMNEFTAAEKEIQL
jgi:MinD-like ATPase involved in chromosome partitioning or flagellar assembly